MPERRLKPVRESAHEPTELLAAALTPSRNRLLRDAGRRRRVKTTAVLLKVTSEPGKPWWESLGLPPPWKWGDDKSFVYVVREQRLLEATPAEARAA